MLTRGFCSRVQESWEDVDEDGDKQDNPGRVLSAVLCAHVVLVPHENGLVLVNLYLYIRGVESPVKLLNSVTNEVQFHRNSSPLLSAILVFGPWREKWQPPTRLIHDTQINNR